MRAPTFLARFAFPADLIRCQVNRRSAISVSNEGISSVEPSSTTVSSIFDRPLAKTESIARRSACARFRVGITIERADMLTLALIELRARVAAWRIVSATAPDPVSESRRSASREYTLVGLAFVKAPRVALQARRAVGLARQHGDGGRAEAAICSSVCRPALMLATRTFDDRFRTTDRCFSRSARRRPHCGTQSISRRRCALPRARYARPL